MRRVLDREVDAPVGALDAAAIGFEARRGDKGLRAAVLINVHAGELAVVRDANE